MLRQTSSVYYYTFLVLFLWCHISILKYPNKCPSEKIKIFQIFIVSFSKDNNIGERHYSLFTVEHIIQSILLQVIILKVSFRFLWLSDNVKAMKEAFIFARKRVFTCGSIFHPLSMGEDLLYKTLIKKTKFILYYEIFYPFYLLRFNLKFLFFVLFYFMNFVRLEGSVKLTVIIIGWN